MPELVLTRANELVDPVMHVWAWQIPVYLFLGGWVAGMMVLSGWFVLGGRHHQRRCSCTMTPWLSVALLSVGMLALFLDLEHKPYVWRLYTTFQPASPMSWGAWILVLVYPALAAMIFVRLPAWFGERVPPARRAADWLARRPAAIRAVGGTNVLLGVMLGIYTGVLLSALGARPLWNSAMLGPLFLMSGMSSAAAFVHLVARDPDERVLLARADNLFLLLEVAAIALLLIGLLSATEAHRQAAALLLGGQFSAVFWVLVVGVGIVLPLVIQSLAVRHLVQHTPVAPVLVLMGGLALRFVLVHAGQVSHWAAAAQGVLPRG